LQVWKHGSICRWADQLLLGAAVHSLGAVSRLLESMLPVGPIQVIDEFKSSPAEGRSAEGWAFPPLCASTCEVALDLPQFAANRSANCQAIRRTKRGLRIAGGHQIPPGVEVRGGLCSGLPLTSTPGECGLPRVCIHPASKLPSRPKNPLCASDGRGSSNPSGRRNAVGKAAPPYSSLTIWSPQHPNGRTPKLLREQPCSRIS
jgi:hypothetical protein